ncbi:ABC transporter ATP-binding protein [Alkaliphilus serpentinus]|nr:ABC transporter ATP-binding protein [Alkaliphilus serpentinus]
MEIIKCSNLGYAYKKNKVLEDISFSIEGGEVLGILGPNGAGKSTLMTLCATLLKPTEGTITYFNDENKEIEDLRTRIGLVPQEIALYLDMTPNENLSFFGRLYGLKKDKLKKQIEVVCELTGISTKEGKKIKELSGGMKRRVNIAAALLSSPEILIMDEPTVGIDTQSRNEILNAVNSMKNSGVTVLYSSHYYDEILKVCSKILVLKDGRMTSLKERDQLKSALLNEDLLYEDNLID